jgi:hypothetical protein
MIENIRRPTFCQGRFNFSKAKISLQDLQPKHLTLYHYNLCLAATLNRAVSHEMAAKWQALN